MGMATAPAGLISHWKQRRDCAALRRDHEAMSVAYAQALKRIEELEELLTLTLGLSDPGAAALEQ